VIFGGETYLRKLVIFGNGLGRSLDNDYYNLETALQSAWDNPAALNEAQKQLIWQCLPSVVLEDEQLRAPKSEAELDTLQRVLAACDEISKYELDGGVAWLSPQGKEFPGAIRSYIHCAASYFHQAPYSLPESFTSPLVDWVVRTRSHIATLNYDELLYRAFINTDAFDGYGCLLDGFVPNFDPENLNRFRPATQAYYLHLHGSPLYYSTANGTLKKAALSSLSAIEGHSSTHLVLTEVKHKMSVIGSSPILREYWKRLEEAMKEAEGIVLFGYGGGDSHLNNLIEDYFKEKTVEIIERKRSEYETKEGESARFAFWKKTLGVDKICAFWLTDILKYDRWDYNHNWK
jgi:hypothetical protein